MERDVERRNAVDHLRFILRWVNRLEAAQALRSGRSLLSIAFRTPVLVLTTTGRRSGRPRDTTLAYLRVGDGDLLVVGGAAGQARLPDWVANVRAHDAVIVTLDAEAKPMTATELRGTERARARALAARAWPRIDRYEARSGRPVPVIRLTPRTC